MGLRAKIIDAIAGRNGKKATVSQEWGGAIPFFSQLMSTYENMFAQVRPLIDEMKVVMPYGVGANGAKKPIAQTPELSILTSSPNEEMGWLEFMDLALAAWLTEPELNIHLHRDGKKVVGYSILPAGCHDLYNDKFYTTTKDNSQLVLTRDEVMTLRFSRSPQNPYRGVSPAGSVLTWTQLDDLVSQYQRAFFQNGAIPATITTIRATSRANFEEKKLAMENGLKGARNHNKTIYIYEQMLADGEHLPEVEVKNIQGNNTTLDIKTLNDIISDRLNKAVGVSDFILGDDSSAKYDNAELSDLQFTKRRVYPALMSFWNQFQFELDRILGGLGYAIGFDLDVPELTDRLKTKAETAKTTSETLTALITAGASPDAVLSALGLGKEWRSVAVGVYTQNLKDRALNANAGLFSSSDKPQLPTGATADAVDPRTGEEITEEELKELEASGVLEEPMPEPEPEWEDDDESKDAKKIYIILAALAALRLAQKKADTEKAKREIEAIMMDAGESGAVEGAEMLRGVAKTAGVSGSDLKKLKITEATSTTAKNMAEYFNSRINTVVANYDESIKTKVAETLRQANAEGWSQSYTKKVLSAEVPKRQAEMIARNETHASINYSKYKQAQELAKELGLTVRARWHAHSGACDICRAMDGTTVDIGEKFPDHHMLETEDGETEVVWEHSEYNAEGLIPDAHPNCRCTFTLEVVE